MPVVVDPRVVQRLHRLAAPLEPRGGGRREDGAQRDVALAQEALAVELRGHRAPV